MKCGTVAVVGRANAGKSTLINVLVGEKIAIVSPKPQTTRERILGILTTESYQVVFEDTPGIYKAANRLNDFMQRQTEQAAREVDLVLFVIDGHAGIKDEDLATLERFEKGNIPVLVAFTKTDIMPKERVPEELVKFADHKLAGVVPVSARRGRNVKKLLDAILELLSEGDYIFPEDVVSDKSERFMLREIVREKLLLKFDKEIPHGVAVVLNEYSIRPSGTAEVNVDIVCEKQNHKAIIIGKQGAALKEVSTFAREGMEKFLGRKVFLTVYVKVKENWRDNPYLLGEYGYKEEK
ncbi:MAG: GTPase Era [Clostridia bacterium]|nr:GTPase Era [Clostridia bacterium]